MRRKKTKEDNQKEINVEFSLKLIFYDGDSFNDNLLESVNVLFEI